METKVKKLFSLLCGAISVFSFVGCTEKVPEGYFPENETGMMFDSPEFTYFYNYAPSVIVDGNKAHVWYCTNLYSGVAGDHIAYRDGIKVNGKWYWSEQRIVLYPGEKGAWDQKHICDPSIIKGMFGYQGKTYSYLMSYLGCMTDGNYENAFGFAVAETPEGPWIRVPEVSPLIDFYTDYGGEDGKMQWGTGQPSLVSVDKKGKILVFYTMHSYPYEWGTMVERWDFSDLQNPKKELSTHVKNDGLLQKDGKQDYITVADFMYDPYRKEMYVGTDVHPFGNLYPDNLTDTSRVAKTNMLNDVVIGDSFRDGKVTWTDMFYVTELETGRGKNTSIGFYRDPYGWLPEKGKIETAISSSFAYPTDNGKLFFTLKLFRVENGL